MTLFWLGILNSACGVGKPVAFWKIERYLAGLYRKDKLLVKGSLYSHHWLQKKANHKIRNIFRNIKVVLFFLSFPFPFLLCLACWREIEKFRLHPKGTGAKTFAMVTLYHAPSCICFKGYHGCQVWMMSLFYCQRYFWVCDPSSSCNILALLSIVCVLPMQIIMSLRVERFAFSPFALTYTRLLAAVSFFFPK